MTGYLDQERGLVFEVQFSVNDCWALRLSIVPRERDCVVGPIQWVDRGCGVETGGLPAKLVDDTALGPYQLAAIAQVRRLVDAAGRPCREHGVASDDVAALWGFHDRNADPAIRKRGPGRTPYRVFAALAALSAAGQTYEQIADRCNCRPVKVAKMLQRSLQLGFRTEGGQLTPDARRILAGHGDDPAAIIGAWRRQKEGAPVGAP